MKQIQSPKEYIENVIEQSVNLYLKEEGKYNAQKLDYSVESKNHQELGDFSSTIAFSVSKIVEKSPIDVADNISEYIRNNIYIKNVEIAGNGFINLFVNEKLFTESFENIEKQISKIKKIGKNKKVIIEFSSPNVAKPLSAGHLRNTVLGEFLSRLYENTGYKVIRWNHLGDWGTQFGKLIVAYKKWGDKKKIDSRPITELLALYVRFTKESSENPELDNEARDEFNKLEKGDQINKKLLSWFLKETIKELSLFYKQLDVHFDVIKGESFYVHKKDSLFKRLKSKGLLEESDGAKIISLEKEGMPPVLLQKTDGSTLYHTRDLLSLEYRVKKYHPKQILYVVGNDQLLYLSQMFAAAKKMGIIEPYLFHVSYGLVFGPGKKKFSTREGNIITANEIIRDVMFKAAAIMHEKHPDPSDHPSKKSIEQVGIGAVKYNILKEGRMSDVVFDFDKMLSFAGNSSPYLQYTYARLLKIIRKSKILVFKRQFTSVDQEDLKIMKKALEFPDYIKMCLSSFSSHPLTDYLFSFANELNAFYEKTSILKDDNIKRKKQRLYMLKMSIDILERGLDLLGIQTLKEI